MDIKLAYLNGLITEDIYMHQPKGYKEKGNEMKVAKLKKGLYGLKQVGCEWYATLHAFLIWIDFRHMHADHSVFVFEWGHSIIIIPVYVDNKLLAGNNECLLDSLQDSIGAHFKLVLAWFGSEPVNWTMNWWTKPLWTELLWTTCLGSVQFKLLIFSICHISINCPVQLVTVTLCCYKYIF